MKVPYVNLPEQHSILKKEVNRAFSTVIKHGGFVLGKEVAMFEEKFAKYCGTKYAVALNSGTDALFLALKALGVGAGDEVITAPNSFLATASAIVATGARPVFVDVRDDQNIDPTLIEAVITTRTRAILPVHLCGSVAEMAQINSIAKKHKLFVVEDAAQAIGSEYKGKKAGALGDVGCFSLHPLKTLNVCGDGGMITTDNKQVNDLVRQLRNIGLKSRTESDVWGYNSRLDTIQAAIANEKFKFVDKWVSVRRKNADFYRKKLSGLVQCPYEVSGGKHAYHLFVIQTDRRDELQKWLEKKGVDTKIHYPIPIHLQKCAEGLGYKKGSFPVTERQAERILSLPIYQNLTKQQLEHVVKSIKDFFTGDKKK